MRGHIQWEKVSLCGIFCRLKISLPVLSCVFFEKDQNCHLLQPITFTVTALVCFMAVGGTPLAVVTDSRGWEHLQEGRQNWHATACFKPTRTNRERLFCVRFKPQEAVPSLRTLPTNLLRWCSNAELLPSDYFSFQNGMCFVDILLTNV